ncbi:MAG TPA: hypothetical protein VK512_23760, partial [Xanthobacteraceae bacterium]|nr:hypothetical protein [Xanthobacteraceae bacterium]
QLHDSRQIFLGRVQSILAVGGAPSTRGNPALAALTTGMSFAALGEANSESAMSVSFSGALPTFAFDKLKLTPNPLKPKRRSRNFSTTPR